MKTIRVLALAAVGGLLALGFVLDRNDRSTTETTRAERTGSLATARDPVTTWFCPGGSGPGGGAELVVEIVSHSSQSRRATVSVAPSGRTEVTGDSLELDIEPGSRVVLEPADKVPGSRWVGAVIEVSGPDVIVEQTVTGVTGGAGRSQCLTGTAVRWIVPYGATRLEAQGERFIVMLLNPFPDDAVADIDFVADVGRDSLNGVVIPAGEVVAIDVTEEVTVAASVTVTVDVVAGSIAVSRIQMTGNSASGGTVRLAPATPGGASVWYLPMAAITDGRRDRVAVTNSSDRFVAEVDLEILVDNPTMAFDPIELTIRPGRTVVVDLSEEERLAGIGPLTVVVRSLGGVPVAVSLDSVVFGPDGTAVGAAATSGADAAARHWLVPVERSGSESGPDRSNVVIVNPSTERIALVDLYAGGVGAGSLELGPGRRALIPVVELPVNGPATDRYMLEVKASSSVVVGRELVGDGYRIAAIGVAVGEAVALVDIS